VADIPKGSTLPSDQLAVAVKMKPCPGEPNLRTYTYRSDHEQEHLGTVCDNGKLKSGVNMSTQPHELCHGTGFVLNTGDPLFEAMWATCAHTNPRSPRWHGKIAPYDCDCNGTGYIRRSRAESALGLLKAIPYLGIEVIELIPHRNSDGTFHWSADVGNAYSVQEDVIDALCAALEVCLRAKGKP